MKNCDDWIIRHFASGTVAGTLLSIELKEILILLSLKITFDDRPLCNFLACNAKNSNN